MGILRDFTKTKAETRQDEVSVDLTPSIEE